MNNKNGFTLVEILLVVGFVALASIGVYTIYDKTKVTNQVNSEVKNLSSISKAIELYSVSEPSFALIDNNYAKRIKAIPEHMIDQSGAIINRFGGQVTIKPINSGSGINNGYRITYTEITPNECSKLATAGSSLFEQVSVGSTIVKNYSLGSKSVDIAAIGIACNSGNTTTISFDKIEIGKGFTVSTSPPSPVTLPPPPPPPPPPAPQPVNGMCGSDSDKLIPNPPTNLCSVGNSTPVISLFRYWQWSCLATNNGTDANCGAGLIDTPPPVAPPPVAPPPVAPPPVADPCWPQHSVIDYGTAIDPSTGNPYVYPIGSANAGSPMMFPLGTHCEP